MSKILNIQFLVLFLESDFCHILGSSFKRQYSSSTCSRVPVVPFLFLFKKVYRISLRLNRDKRECILKDI